MNFDYPKILDEILIELAPFRGEGKVATYIPELSDVDPEKFGICLHCYEDKFFARGDWQEPFSIQSISKVFSLALAFSLKGEDIWKRLDVEPSGDPFNSLVLLESEKGIPRNPFINSGALVIADTLVSLLKNPKEDFLAFVRKISGNETLNFDLKVAESERTTGHRNAALAYLLKSFDNLHNDVNDVLDFYFHQCALAMTCFDLAKSFMLFANHGMIADTEEIVIEKTKIKRIHAVMQTCGFYDEAGEFSFRVGLPGKSGVGGGIVAVNPHKYSVAVWSPRLNPRGNSSLGMKALELLTTKTGVSIF